MFCFNLLSNGHRIENATNPLIAEIFIHRTSQVSQADRHDFKHMRCRYTRIVFFFNFCSKIFTFFVCCECLFSGQHYYFICKMRAQGLTIKCLIVQHVIELHGYKAKKNIAYRSLSDVIPKDPIRP